MVDLLFVILPFTKSCFTHTKHQMDKTQMRKKPSWTKTHGELVFYKSHPGFNPCLGKKRLETKNWWHKSKNWLQTFKN